jgi:hypothetical protein
VNVPEPQTRSSIFGSTTLHIGVNHILLTRFNLPSLGLESLIRADEGWLRDRFELFERYCLPSVTAQTSRNFSWIIYFDPASPKWLRDQIAPYVRAGAFVPIYRETVSNQELVSDLRAVIDHEGEVLITTNLDNDDGLAVDFVERVQSVVTTNDRTAIYLTGGLIRRSKHLYHHRYRRNAFVSVREYWSSPVTSWSEWHTDFDRRMPVVEMNGPPGWLQVIHGSNVSNRVKGRLVAAEPYRNRFGSLLDGIENPSALGLMRDRFVARPARLARESGRIVTKRIVLSVLGREGLDRVKVFWRLRAGLRRSSTKALTRLPELGVGRELD